MGTPSCVRDLIVARQIMTVIIESCTLELIAKYKNPFVKKIVISLLTISLIAGIVWQNRLNILLSIAPTLRAWQFPVGPNQPVLWTQGPTQASLPPSQRPPNIILILADDMGFNDISLHNGGAADGSLQTTAIDGLAQDGVQFQSGYAANAVCAPSRASILTGRYSTRFGFEFTPFFKIGATIFQWAQDLSPGALPVHFNDTGIENMPNMTAQGLPPSEITIAELLRDAGYYTAHIGKWHLGGSTDMPEMLPQNQGFIDSLYMSGMLYRPEDHPDVVNAKRPNQSIERMVWSTAQYAASFNGSARFEPQGYLTDYYTNEALKVIDQHQNEPFFLYLAHWGIHNPLQAARADYEALSHIEDHTLRVYAAMIRALDRSVRRITEKLAETGLADNTLIVFTSDNGGASYIGLPNINQPYRGWKLTLFEGGTHVPFLAKWPAKIEAGTQFDAPIHHMDLFSTFAAAAGAPIPTDRIIDGVNLLPYLNGSKAEAPHETLFWLEGHQETVLHRGMKLIRAQQPRKFWLFDLKTDPTEQFNLATQQPETVKRLNERLDAHRLAQAAPMWPSLINAPQLIDKHGEQPFEVGDEFIYWAN